LKRSLNIAMDFVDAGQDLRGYRTLNLLNVNNDATFLRGILYTEISRHYIPTPKMNHLRVVINGESWGVYLNAQQFNGDFIGEWFKPTGGARWKAPGSPRGKAGLEYLGDDVAAYKQIYEIKTKDESESWSALMQLCKVLNTTPADRLEAALTPLLDLDATLKFMAVEIAMANPDGYWTRASDYNIYRDTAGRFHLIPHDVNEALGGEGGARRATLDPLSVVSDPTKPLYSKLLAVPALRQKYLSYVREIAGKWLDWNTLLPIAKASHTLIAADVTADTRKLYDNAGFVAGVADTGNPLRTFFDARRAYLLEVTGP
jgi:spore coat protein CotH